MNLLFVFLVVFFISPFQVVSIYLMPQFFCNAILSLFLIRYSARLILFNSSFDLEIISCNSSLFEFIFLCYIIIAILSLSHVNWAVLNFIDFFIKTSICMIWWINAVEMKTRAHTHRRAETHRGIAPEWSGILMLHLTILESFSVYLKMTLICILFYIFSRE